MSGELANAARDFTAALDSMDVDRLLETMADDAQGVDEISRRWIRGKGDLDNYLRELIRAVSGVQTELRDVEERIWGEGGIVTCWLEQDYALDGDAQHVSAPTTIGFVRIDGGWKVSLFHSIPLAEQP